MWTRVTDVMPPAGKEVKMKWADGENEFYGDPIRELEDVGSRSYKFLLWWREVEAATANQDHEDFVLGRLYDWLIDPNRKPSITAFTSGSLRKVAREIEYALAYDDLITDALVFQWRVTSVALERNDLGDI